MKIRMSRKFLDESLETLAEIEPTMDAIKAYIKKHHPDSSILAYSQKEFENATLVYYSSIPDKRIPDWPVSYLVMIADIPWAWTNGPLKEKDGRTSKNNK